MTLYSRPGSGLCDDVKAIVAEVSAQLSLRPAVLFFNHREDFDANRGRSRDIHAEAFCRGKG